MSAAVGADLDMSPLHAEIRDVARRFAVERVAPQAEELDREARFPYDLVEEMGRLGFFGLTIPEEFGGTGLGSLAYSLVIEEVAAAESGVAINITDQALTASCILNFAAEGLKTEWLPPMARGEVLGAFGLTEPGSGSDAGGLRTRAALDGGEWVIDGSKQFITNAGTRLTKLIVLLARTGDREDGSPELSMLLVPTDAVGVSVGDPYRKTGWRCSDTRPMFFDGVRIPASNLIGRRGDGLKQMLMMLDGGRIGVASNAIGVAQACLDASRDYANGRRQFGRPLAAFQATQFKLADMATGIELARLITRKAARLADAGLPHRLEASMAKLHATRTAKQAADEAVQIQGGNGFMDDSAVARYWRTVKVLEIGEGTNEIQKLIIAREIGAAG